MTVLRPSRGKRKGGGGKEEEVGIVLAANRSLNAAAFRAKKKMDEEGRVKAAAVRETGLLTTQYPPRGSNHQNQATGQCEEGTCMHLDHSAQAGTGTPLPKPRRSAALSCFKAAVG